MTDYQTLVKKLISDDPDLRQQSRQQLYMLDEAAVAPLIDEFYAGVREQAGLAILEVLTEIGGYEVIALFESIIYFNDGHPSWSQAAQNGLNSHKS